MAVSLGSGLWRKCAFPAITAAIKGQTRGSRGIQLRFRPSTSFLVSKITFSCKQCVSTPIVDPEIKHSEVWTVLQEEMQLFEAQTLLLCIFSITFNCVIAGFSFNHILFFHIQLLCFSHSIASWFNIISLTHVFLFLFSFKLCCFSLTFLTLLVLSLLMNV